MTPKAERRQGCWSGRTSRLVWATPRRFETTTGESAQQQVGQGRAPSGGIEPNGGQQIESRQSVPNTAPIVFAPYRVPMRFPDCWVDVETKRDNSGRVMPIQKVGGSSNNPSNTN